LILYLIIPLHVFLIISFKTQSLMPQSSSELIKMKIKQTWKCFLATCFGQNRPSSGVQNVHIEENCCTLLFSFFLVPLLCSAPCSCFCYEVGTLFFCAGMCVTHTFFCCSVQQVMTIFKCVLLMAVGTYLNNPCCQRVEWFSLLNWFIDRFG
jgi:hypothetical protein